MHAPQPGARRRAHCMYSSTYADVAGRCFTAASQTRWLLVAGLERPKHQPWGRWAGGAAKRGVKSRAHEAWPAQPVGGELAAQPASTALQTHTGHSPFGHDEHLCGKYGVDGADSSVNTVGTVGDPHVDLDQELVVPDYDDDDETAEPSPQAPADPAACIAEFKAKREKHERWALAVILNVFLIVAMGPMLLLVLAAWWPVGRVS